MMGLDSRRQIRKNLVSQTVKLKPTKKLNDSLNDSLKMRPLKKDWHLVKARHLDFERSTMRQIYFQIGIH
jgi:hypothetical protein